MPSPADREDPFERLLRRSLQGQRAPAQECLDAETLASIVDGRLSGNGLGAAEAHVADCARCQATLAVLVRTAPEPQPPAAWWRLPSVRWLVPATAAAAAVTLWLAVDREPRVVQVRQVAVPEASVQVRPTAPAPPTDALRDNAAPSPAAAAPRVSADASQGGAAPVVPAPPERRAASKESSAPVEAPIQAGQSAAVATEPPPSVPSPGAVAGGIAGFTPPPQATAPSAADLAGARTRTVAASPPPPASPSPVAASQLRAEANALAEMVAIIRDIPSSDPRFRWRLRGSAVQRTTDAGATWHDQSTGTVALLTAGAAVSPEVCWLVGAQGLVLVTVDGLSWQRVTAPASEALVSVSATSADAAMVTTRDGRTFATVDRGRTWTPR